MKKRLDVILHELKYFDSREKSKREIMVGNVIINENIVTKPGSQFKIEEIKSIKIKDKLKYVSRGGLKLEKAISYWKLNFKDKIVLDIGASTGGFTDCSLKNGASKVYANDVGTNQLDYSLRNNNNNVISIEKTNIKELKLDELVDIIVIDVSFISLTKVIPYFSKFLKFHGEIVALIKPQFEVGKDKIGKNGIVVEKEYQQEAISKVIDSFKKNEFQIIDIVDSPILGAKGNKEFLIYVKNK